LQGHADASEIGAEPVATRGLRMSKERGSAPVEKQNRWPLLRHGRRWMQEKRYELVKWLHRPEQAEEALEQERRQKNERESGGGRRE
jgi:hypothetical protein